MTAPGDDQQTAGPPQAVGMRRHLLFGLALALAFGSIYAGVLDSGRVLQWSLAVGAAIVVLVALASSAATRR